MGHRFYEGTVPALVEAINDQTEVIKEQNKLLQMLIEKQTTSVEKEESNEIH